MKAPDSEATRQRSFWLASRGAQQMDLAERFSAAAHGAGLRVLALKGISLAEELYGGASHRPMADIDFLAVDPSRFERTGEVCRSLGLEEEGASDHALVFREPASRVVLELHVSLTACPGLFTIDHDALWGRRVPVAAAFMFRLSDEDLIVHLALHTAFQHAFVANEYHYGDFVRALAAFRPDPLRVMQRASDWGALKALAAMAVACRNEIPESTALGGILEGTKGLCPAGLLRRLDRPHLPSSMSVAALGRVRYELAPSKWGYLRRSVFPRAIPGRSSPRPGALRRLARIVDAGLSSPSGPRP